ncbi:MAG: hypothetical protein ACREBJ_11030, partial [Nitrosotalea sp.]
HHLIASLIGFIQKDPMRNAETKHKFVMETILGMLSEMCLDTSKENAIFNSAESQIRAVKALCKNDLRDLPFEVRAWRFSSQDLSTDAGRAQFIKFETDHLYTLFKDKIKNADMGALMLSIFLLPYAVEIKPASLIRPLQMELATNILQRVFVLDCCGYRRHEVYNACLDLIPSILVLYEAAKTGKIHFETLRYKVSRTYRVYLMHDQHDGWGESQAHLLNSVSRDEIPSPPPVSSQSSNLNRAAETSVPMSRMNLPFYGWG